jgi:hypothetical protein
VRLPFPPGSTKALSPLPWQGPSPLPQRHVDPWPAGGPKPPASARPAPGGRFSPAGSGAGLSLCLDLPICGEPSRTGGETQGVSCSGPERRWSCACREARSFRQGPSPLPQRPADPRPAGGPKPPASARPAPGGRFPSAGGGRWPVGVPGPAGLRGTVPHGRGKRVRFLIPPAPTKARSPLGRQGPSPLPQRYAASRPAGGQNPPASARPAPGGRFPPAGSGTGLSWCGLHGSWWQRRAGGGNAVPFGVPPGRAIPFPGSGRFSWQAGGRIVFSAPSQGAARHRRRPGDRSIIDCERPGSSRPLRTELVPGTSAIPWLWL